jgi:Protein of unknown function (DUF2848)
MANLIFKSSGKDIHCEINQLVIAGWTGRNKEAVEHHIEELAKLGVARPRTVPCFYRGAENLLSTASSFQVVGHDSSGEVEYVLFSLPDGLYVGLGSDHTDRKVEAYGVTVSKQMCPKPVAPEVWRFDEVEGHWDSLVTRSWVTRNGKKELYQEGSVARMLPPKELIERYAGSKHLPVGTAMFCGTHSVIGDIGGGDIFEIELEDPVLKRKIAFSYQTYSLEIAD